MHGDHIHGFLPTFDIVFFFHMTKKKKKKAEEIIKKKKGKRRKICGSKTIHVNPKVLNWILVI